MPSWQAQKEPQDRSRPRPQLWASGNHDARILALMIADPSQADPPRSMPGCATSTTTSSPTRCPSTSRDAPRAQERAEQWINPTTNGSPPPAGISSPTSPLHDQSLPDSYFESCLDRIERDLHSQQEPRPPSMNNAVIAIGLRNDALEAQAVAAAAAHRQSGRRSRRRPTAKPPTAIPYIRERPKPHANRRNARSCIRSAHGCVPSLRRSWHLGGATSASG